MVFTTVDVWNLVKNDGWAAHRTGIRREDLGEKVQVNDSSHNLYDNMLFYWNSTILYIFIKLRGIEVLIE